MDRTLFYPGSIPLDTFFLQPSQDTMKAIGMLIQAAFGTSTFADGLACTQTAVPSMSVIVGPGSISALQTVDPNAYGSLGADSVDALMKMGINIAPTTLSAMTAPASAGQSVVYLVQAAFSETDSVSVVLPYYNSTNPALPYSGPGGGDAAQNTRRLQTVNLQLKQGTPATTGSQAQPAADIGFSPLYAITIANGQTTVTNGNIAVASGAPFLPAKLGPLGASVAAINSEIATINGDIAAINGDIAADASELASHASELASHAAILAAFGTGSIGGNGWMRLPGGIIIQWMNGQSATGNGDWIAFPTAFPNGCLAVVASEGNATGWESSPPIPTMLGTASRAANAFQLWTVQLLGSGCAFQSIGYNIIAVGY